MKSSFRETLENLENKKASSFSLRKKMEATLPFYPRD